MRSGRRFLTALVAAGTVAAIAGPAFAAQSVTVRMTNGTSRTCTVVAVTPSVNRTTKIITTSAQVKCSTTGSVNIALQVVEMDSTVEDPTIQVPEFTKTVTITKANTYQTFAYATAYKCVSTEIDNEELATKAKVAIGATWSAIDRIAQSTNTSPC